VSITLKSELERERIALELHEEKKAQAERKRQLQEQAERIENLSTMVLYSAMDDREKCCKKVCQIDAYVYIPGFQFYY